MELGRREAVLRRSTGFKEEMRSEPSPKLIGIGHRLASSQLTFFSQPEDFLILSPAASELCLPLESSL